MTEKDKILDVPSTTFASLHPAIAALETAMGEQKEKVAKAEAALARTRQHLKEVEPTAWSAKIEAASKNADELARIRTIYDEQGLGFMTNWLCWESVRDEMMRGRSRIYDAIIGALVAREDLRARDEVWLKPIIEARLLVASRLHGQEPGEDLNLSPNDSLILRLHKVQTKAFRAMAAALSQSTQRRPYTTELVVNGKSVQSYLSEGVDLRKVWHCPFHDCRNAKHPASVKLAGLFERVEAALMLAIEVETELKSEQNGSVNERQHAARMLDFLHHENATDAAYYCGGNLEEQIKAQNRRRLDYETYRQALLVVVRIYRALVEEFVDTLKAATSEALTLLGEVEENLTSAAERVDAVRRMMNNCLAGDACLRRWVRELKELEETLSLDLSRGAGSRALGSAFEDLAKHYAYGVEKRREVLASAAPKSTKQD